MKPITAPEIVEPLAPAVYAWLSLLLAGSPVLLAASRRKWRWNIFMSSRANPRSRQLTEDTHDESPWLLGERLGGILSSADSD